MKYIRWQGLIAFILIVAGITGVSLLFVDSWIKWGIEKFATTAVGAEVDVGAVSHRLSPLGLTISGIEVTDSSQPMQNKLVVGKIQFDMALMPLLSHKLIVDNLQADGVAFNQPRKTAGKVYRQPQPSSPAATTDTEQKRQLPDVKTLLAKTPLRTTAAAEQLNQAYQQQQQAVKASYAALPDKAELTKLQEQVKALTSKKLSSAKDLLTAKQQFDQLKKQIKAEKAKVDAFKTTLKQAQSDIAPKLAALKQAPQQDYQQLQGLLSGDQNSYAQLTQAIFGESAKQWSERLFSAYELIAPMLQKQSSKPAKAEHQRSAGRWITFADESGLPQVLIRRATVTVNWQQQSFQSHWQNITNDNDTLGKATTFRVKSDRTPLWQTLNINGDWWLGNEGMTAHQQWQLSGVDLPGKTLSNSNKLQATLQKALLDSTGKLSVKHNVLSGNGTLALSAMEVDAKGTNKLTNLIADSLQKLTNVKIDGDISGTMTSPNLQLHSDLDNQIAKLVNQKVSSEAQSKLTELKTSLNSRATAALGGNQDIIKNWQAWGGEADNQQDQIEKMLKSKLQGVAEQKKQQMLDKLKNKLFGEG